MRKPDRIAYDTEFMAYGNGIELVSIAMINETTGQELYAINREVNTAKLLADEWLRENVWPSLPTRPCEPSKRCHSSKSYHQHLDRDDPDVRPRRQIARMVEKFLSAAYKPQLWAYYSAYDHVAYAELFGQLTALPRGLPMFSMDIKQEAVRLGNPELPQQATGAHHALEDARHNLVMLKFLDGVNEEQVNRLRHEAVALSGGFDD